MSGGAVSIVVIASFLLSVLTYITVQIGGGRSERVSRLQRCVEQNKALEKQNDKLQARIEILQEENIAVMRKLLRNGGN